MSSSDSFENAWFVNQSSPNLTERFAEIRTYAYLVFDSLDTNKNGFIELDELASALEQPQYSEREKSFVSFLLNNHSAIADSSQHGDSNGISRNDIEAYFKLIEGLV